MRVELIDLLALVSLQLDTLGSTTAFIALHSKMLELNRIAIARVITRANIAPRLFALVAQVCVKPLLLC